MAIVFYQSTQRPNLGLHLNYESHETTWRLYICLLYTSDAADDMQCVDLGGRRIIKK